MHGRSGVGDRHVVRIIAPLTHGLTSIVDEADFDAERWFAILQSERVTVWYTAPTAIRMPTIVGAAAVRQHAFPALRLLASVGEPLNPEAVVWGVEAFGRPFHDNWWQTQTGGMMIVKVAAMDVWLGSMGRPLPGIETALVRRTAEQTIDVIETPDSQGRVGAAAWLAIDVPGVPVGRRALPQVLRRRLLPDR